MRAPTVSSPIRLLLLCSLAACSSNGSAHPADSSNGRTGAFSLTAEQRARIHLVTVQNQPFRPTLEATGTVAFNGDRSTPVLSPISGPALQILVNPGAVVKKGDALATVSSPDFAAAVASYRKAESAYRNLKRIADLDEQLFKNDAIARRDLEQAQTDAAGAAADRDAAIQQMRSLGVQESQIEAIRQDTPMTEPMQATIRAPIDGTVVEKLISPGQLLQAGTTQCFTIADLSSMWVLANVFPSDVKDVTVGEPVDVITDASTVPLQGRVDYVAALVDPTSKAIAVRVLVPNLNHVLRRDMFVHVGIHANHEHTGMLVPTTSVLRDEENLPFVYVVANGSFERRRITLGSRVEDRYEVTSGIAPGDKVVSEGALFLQFAESQ